MPGLIRRYNIATCGVRWVAPDRAPLPFRVRMG